MNFKKRLRSLLSILLALTLFILPAAGCGSSYGEESTGTDSIVTSDASGYDDTDNEDDAGNPANLSDDETDSDIAETAIDEDGSYTSKTDVMNYLIQYGKLPGNFITKKEAKKLGWSGGSLEPYASGKCIGGDYFGNYEEKLPVVSGRTYHECDIDTLGADSRGAKRIVYSNDGQIYYTEDHYETFTLLYGDD